MTAHDPRGHRIPELSRAPTIDTSDLGWPTIAGRNERFAITPDTVETWDGTPVDYPELIDWIIRTEKRNARCPTGASPRVS